MGKREDTVIEKWQGVLRLISATSLLLTLWGLCRGNTIEVSYGKNAYDRPTPDNVAQLVKLHEIKYLGSYDSNIHALKAFANTGVELIIGILNPDLLLFSQFQYNADTWQENCIHPYS